MENEQKNVGAIRKVGDFLGISKFGQGLATSYRVLSGKTGQDIKRLNENTEQVNKLMYAYKQEKDPVKKQKLLQLAVSQGKMGEELDPFKIDPGLGLKNREILGSAANIGLNILTPGAFKGSKAAIIGKNALLGAGFGAATGMEKGRSNKGVVGSTIFGGLVGGALGLGTVGLRVLKDFTTKATPKWLMNNAIKPTLDEARKTIKYGNKTFGEELLQEGVKGGPKKLLDIAATKTASLEDDLQRVLSHPSLSEVRITKSKIAPYLKEAIEKKTGIPGLKGEVKKIENLVADLPEKMTLQEANQLKRKIYNELRDVAYKLDAKLSAKAVGLKQIAKGLKTEIEKEVGGTIVSDINNKLSLYGRLEDRIVDQLARSSRNNQFGLTDAILASGGLATMNPTGFLAALGGIGARHAGTSIKTRAAQNLSKLGQVGQGKLGKTLGGATRRGILNIP